VGDDDDDGKFICRRASESLRRIRLVLEAGASFVSLSLLLWNSRTWRLAWIVLDGSSSLEDEKAVARGARTNRTRIISNN